MKVFLDYCFGGRRPRQMLLEAVPDIEIPRYDAIVDLRHNATDPEVLDWCAKQEMAAIITWNYRDMLRPQVVEQLLRRPLRVFVGREPWANAKLPDKVQKVVELWPRIAHWIERGDLGIYQLYWHRKEVRLLHKCADLSNDLSFDTDE